MENLYEHKVAPSPISVAVEYAELLREFRAADAQHAKPSAALGLPEIVMERICILHEPDDTEWYWAILSRARMSSPGDAERDYAFILDDSLDAIDGIIRLKRLSQRAGNVLPDWLKTRFRGEPGNPHDCWWCFVIGVWIEQGQPGSSWIQAHEHATSLRERIGLKLTRGERFSVQCVPSVYKLSVDAIEAYQLAALSGVLEFTRNGDAPGPTIVSLGKRRYQIAPHMPVEVTDREDRVLEALLNAPGIGKLQLGKDSGIFDEAPRVLKKLTERYGGIFAPAIHLPGRRSRGGYRVDFAPSQTVDPT
jgi:hypothetical protein